MDIKQLRWKEVEYSRSQIIKAGKTVRDKESTPIQIADTTQVIDNWRATHAYPLHVIYMLQHVWATAVETIGLFAKQALHIAAFYSALEEQFAAVSEFIRQRGEALT